MKLLYIDQYFTFPNQVGGTRSYDLSRSFAQKGIEVVVISSSHEHHVDSAGNWSVIQQDGITLHRLNCRYNNKMSFFRRIYAFLYFMFFATLRSLKIKCDMFLVSSTPLTVAIPALVKKLIHRTPYIFEARDVWPEVPIKMGVIKNIFLCKLLYGFEGLIYKKASWIVPLSDGMKNNILSRFDISEKITVIPNISEISRFHLEKKEILSDRSSKILLYAGTMGAVNGLRYLVDLAYLTLKIDRTIQYHIYGSGKQESELRKYAIERGVSEVNLFFKGKVSKSELPIVYASATVGSSFVIDNSVLWDNSANKFFDTLAASKPIVINHEGWQADVIRSCNIGYVLPPTIEEVDACKFVKYLNNVGYISQQGSNALEVAKERYSLVKASNKYMEIFKNLSANV